MNGDDTVAEATDAIDPKADVVVLTAIYSDWESFLELARRLDRVFAEHGAMVRIVLVDDGSPVFADEQGFDKLNLPAVRDITVVTLTRNLGNQRAVALGVGYVADNMTCDYLVVMDADLEDSPEHVPMLLARARREHNTVVFASRTGRHDGRAFKMFYGVYKFLYRALTGMPISIGNFSAIPGRLVRRIASISEISSHFPAGIMRARVPFATVPARRGKREFGRSKMNLVNLVVHGVSGFVVHADVVAVRVILAILGLTVAILGLIALLVVYRLLGDITTMGWTSQLVTILGGVLFQGLIASVLIAFLVLAGRNQRVIIPAAHYRDFVLDIARVYPVSEA